MLNRIVEELKFAERRTILSDRRAIFALRDFLSEKEAKFGNKVKRVWKRQQESLKRSDLEAIVETRSLPQRTMDSWANQIREFVVEEVYTEYIGAIKTSGDTMARRINRQRKQSFEFDPASTNSLVWVNENGGRLIVELTKAQYDAVHALIHHQVFMGITSPYQLQQLLTPLIGLTSREATAVLRYRLDLIAQGVDASTITKMTEKYQAFLHRSRAARIARTELAKAYNHGQYQSILQGIDAGYVEGEIEKTWLTGGDSDRMCEECDAMDGESVPIDQPFSNGIDTPPAHPQCRCSVGYSVRR